jgi:hypothetical protein
MSEDPAPVDEELETLWTELATIATDIARLLVQLEHDGADVEALDVRAAAVRKRIKEVQAQQGRPEPPKLFHHPHWYGSRLLSGG